MTAEAPARAATDARTAWTIGGGLVILSALCAAIDQLVPTGVGPAALTAAVLWAAALIIFAVGIRGSGSVTARRPAGTVVFVVFAVWGIIGGVQLTFFPLWGGIPLSAIIAIGYVVDAITLILALLAALAVAGSGAVARRWNQAPLWVLGVLIVRYLVPFAVLSATPHPLAIYSVVGPIEAVVTFVATAFLGVVAIVLSNRGTLTPPRLT